MRRVPEPADMQLLEQHRAFLGEGVVAALETFLNFDRSGFAHRNGGVGRIFRQPESALNTADLRLADEYGDAVDLRMIVRLDDYFMIRPDQLELRVYGADNVPVCSHKTKTAADPHRHQSHHDTRAPLLYLRTVCHDRILPLNAVDHMG
jgi:hypothetical protein